MAQRFPDLHYPDGLPVVEHRDRILEAVRENQIVVVVGETGSGKTTQLPKMIAEALGERGGRIGVTQPRRIAAASVAARVAEELRVPLGGFVGYQVRFEERVTAETGVKFMTDGILLAESQGDPELRQYAAIMLDEAHERSLNIDFLLGYLKRLLVRRRDLKLVISSATLDAGAFSSFFGDAPVIEVPGRTFPVEEFFLPPDDDEDLAGHVARAVGWLTDVDPRGDVLVFLPGEREIRECADALEGRGFSNTEILPLFARLGLNDQQKIFRPGPRRRVILATNVAETSLTIPRIVSVVDSGLARVNRWSPARGVQRLMIEPVSQASARQRKGRCGRVREGVCVRLYSEDDLTERPQFTDPEIRRSSLAGVILRMKSLGLPEIAAFPFLDPPSPKAISEGYRTLREVGALDYDKELTPAGRKMARMPVDPRLAKMLLAARDERCLAEILPVVAGLESNDPRERPSEKTREADAAHVRWKDESSDFISILKLWMDLNRFRDGRGWRRNPLRKYCQSAFLNFRRVLEWANVHDELKELLAREMRWEVKPLPRADDAGPRADNAKDKNTRRAKDKESAPDLSSAAAKLAPYDAIHRALLAGVPRQFGLWDTEQRAYRSASGGFFAVFPGSGLFGGKRHEWVVGMELVETAKLWARKIAKIDPAWVEKVAPHLCRSLFSDAHWDISQGAVYGKETVICGGLPIISNRPVHYGRVDPVAARTVFIREALLACALKTRCPFMDHLDALREEVETAEHKLRRPGGLWSDEVLLQLFGDILPAGMCTEREFHDWRKNNEGKLMPSLANLVPEDLGALGLDAYPDTLCHDGQEYPVYYRAAPGERDDGTTLGVHIDQLWQLPDWLPGWGVPGTLRERTEFLLRALPKDMRRLCQPVSAAADGFAERWADAPPDAPVERRLAEYVTELTGFPVRPDDFDLSKLPDALTTKIWVCDDDGSELAMGACPAELRQRLAPLLRGRHEAAANERWERTGMKTWDGDALPTRIDTGSGAVYPALVDEGASLGVRAFLCQATARESHRAACVRMVVMAHADHHIWLRKNIRLGMATKFELPRLCPGGISIEDITTLAAEGALGIPLPRAPGDARDRVASARTRWHESAQAVAKALDASVDCLPPIRAWIEAKSSDRHLGPVAADLAEELQWLLRGRFLWRAGFGRVKSYDRYFRAIRTRLGRIESLPLVKDLEKLARVRRYWQPWMQAWTAAPDEPRWWDFGWQLEEFRISLFAPDMPTEGKCSEKRLEDAWRELTNQ
jgi:ATP-dependent helicase HrpA